MSGFMRVSKVGKVGIDALVGYKDFCHGLRVMLREPIRARRDYCFFDAAGAPKILEKQAEVYSKGLTNSAVTAALADVAAFTAVRPIAQQLIRNRQGQLSESLSLMARLPEINAVCQMPKRDDKKRIQTFEDRIKNPTIEPVVLSEESIRNKIEIDKEWENFSSQLNFFPTQAKIILNKHKDSGCTPLVAVLLMINSSLRPSGKGLHIGELFSMDFVGSDISSYNDRLIHKMEGELKAIVSGQIPSNTAQNQRAMEILRESLQYEVIYSEHSEKLKKATEISESMSYRSFDGNEMPVVIPGKSIDRENLDMTAMALNIMQNMIEDDVDKDPVMIMLEKMEIMFEKIVQIPDPYIDISLLIGSQEDAENVSLFLEKCNPAVFTKRLGGNNTSPGALVFSQGAPADAIGWTLPELLRDALTAYNLNAGTENAAGRIQEIHDDINDSDQRLMDAGEFLGDPSKSVKPPK